MDYAFLLKVYTLIMSTFQVHNVVVIGEKSIYTFEHLISIAAEERDRCFTFIAKNILHVSKMRFDCRGSVSLPHKVVGLDIVILDITWSYAVLLIKIISFRCVVKITLL